MTFGISIIYNHDRMSSTTRVLHTKTWEYLTSCLSYRFIHSPEVVKEAIMTDINDLVQEFLKTSSDGAFEASIIVMRRLFEILQECSDGLEVCFNICSIFATATWLIKFYRCRITGSHTIPIGVILTTEAKPSLC